MFTGIIEAVGKISQVKKLNNRPDSDLSLEIASGNLDLSDVAAGDSIALDGVCLTVTEKNHDSFSVNVSQETLNCTYGLNQPGKRVNLEKALRLADRLGGHLVSGHIDGTGTVVAFKPAGECYILTIQASKPLLQYIAPKGSIAVNGVSLTVNQIQGDEFSINLIPHTLTATTLNELVSGATVNLETDLLARYVARIVDTSK